MAVSQREERERARKRDRKEKDIECGIRTKYEVEFTVCCITADFNVTCRSTPVYIPLHALAQGYCGHWLHGDQNTVAALQL